MVSTEEWEMIFFYFLMKKYFFKLEIKGNH